MKKIAIMLIACCIIPTAAAQPTLEVYESDGQTPFDGHDLMVGTRLGFVVSQDCTDYWAGGLFITGSNRCLGALTAPGALTPFSAPIDPNCTPDSMPPCNPDIMEWPEAHYANAGKYAKVTTWTDSERCGFDMYGSDIVYGSDFDNSVGNWFVIGYEAIEEGEPNVWFCDYDVNWYNPVSFETFTQVPSRDFNDDDIVNLCDFSIFAAFWLSDDCQDPNWCGNTDLDKDGSVDVTDLADFAEFWLWEAEYRTEAPETIPDDPNEPTPDADFIYSITDPNGLDEITLIVDQTVTLYVNMAAIDPGVILNVFDIEVNISDSNLGSIDNTEYNGGTAQILAQPRMTMFDYWGPGTEQYEGIEFLCANIFGPISEGRMASFEFTCQGPGDVTLTLLNNGYENALLQEILIHQIEDPMELLGGMWDEEPELQQQYTKEEWNAFINTAENSE